MKRNLLITGATGAIGIQFIRGALLSEECDRLWVLSRQPPAELHSGSVEWLCGDIRDPQLGLSSSERQHLSNEVEVIIHGAALTQITASQAALHFTNVTGTNNVLDFSIQCSKLERFLHISATQSVGEVLGTIRERSRTEPCAFSNAYDKSKWEAEQKVLSAGLPTEILRLAPVLGNGRPYGSGRLGPWQTLFGWLHQGYLPLLPGAAEAPFDFVSQEMIGLTISHMLRRETIPDLVTHLAQGVEAPTWRQVLDCLEGLFKRLDTRWLAGKRTMPEFVDAQTFRYFQQAVSRSGHPLYRRVADHASYFLPSLLFPKVLATSHLQKLFSSTPLRCPWRKTLEKTVVELAKRHWPMASPIEPIEEPGIILYREGVASCKTSR